MLMLLEAFFSCDDVGYFVENRTSCKDMANKGQKQAQKEGSLHSDARLSHGVLLRILVGWDRAVAIIIIQ
jgi:Mg2+/Co2+ transporter CorB